MEKQEEINLIIKGLGRLRGKIPKQTIKTIRGQAIKGDIEGARKGLEKARQRAIENK